MALTTRLMALTGLPLDMDVETKSASAIHACAIDLWKCPLFATPSASLVLRELVHEQANDLNDDDMDTTEAGIGDENEAFIDDENENYMDFEYVRHQLLAQGQKHVIRTQCKSKENHVKENIKQYKVNDVQGTNQTRSLLMSTKSDMEQAVD
uniref:Uncharacterized protein n=1 Tax=Oryza barthii TaxID=65489 RepID=A0A0D3GIU7_9ORYZ